MTTITFQPQKGENPAQWDAAWGDAPWSIRVPDDRAVEYIKAIGDLGHSVTIVK